MTFRNAIRLSLLNVDKVWKLILYRIVVWAIIIGLMSPCFFMLSEAFNELLTTEAFKNLVAAGAFYTGAITESCVNFANVFIGFLTILANSYIGVLIYYIFLIFILLPTLMNMGKYTVNSMMYGYMSSHSRNSFCTTYIGCFGKALVFGLFRSLLNIVFNLSVFAIFYTLLNIPGQSFAYVMPYIFVIIASVILTIKQLLIMGWAPAMIVCGYSAAKGFGFGVRTTVRRFGISFMTCFVSYAISILLLLGFGVFSIVVIVPCFATFTVMSEIILFFGNHGMKYYIDQETIISPKRHEELDKINQIKFLL